MMATHEIDECYSCLEDMDPAKLKECHDCHNMVCGSCLDGHGVCDDCFDLIIEQQGGSRRVDITDE